MKKLIIVLSLFLTGCTPQKTVPLPSPSPSSQLATITLNQQTYSYAYTVIDDLSRLKLFSNHSAKLSSQELINRYSCQILVNGNFYDESDRSLGWLVSDSQVLSKPINSTLFNGFLSLSPSKVEISPVIPAFPVVFGLQSGPLLILNSQPLLLKINNDESRRRVVAALTEKHQLVFLIISSPLLADVPALVSAIGRQINQPFVAAINLDGGSASAFITPAVQLKEYSYIGSFFCYN